MGTRELLIKLGEHGACDISKDQSVFSHCFVVELKGAIGSGDSTIPGFLAARLKGLSAKESLTIAVATGAFNVEAPDSLSGIPNWENLLKRLSGNWEKRTALYL